MSENIDVDDLVLDDDLDDALDGLRGEIEEMIPEEGGVDVDEITALVDERAEARFAGMIEHLTTEPCDNEKCHAYRDALGIEIDDDGTVTSDDDDPDDDPEADGDENGGDDPDDPDEADDPDESDDGKPGWWGGS